MAVITRHSKLIDIPTKTISGIEMTATDAMTIVNNDIYCICSKHDKKSVVNKMKYPVVMHKFYNYLPEGSSGKTDYSVVTTSAGSKIIARHSNSITYHNHLFYMVTRNGTGSENQIMAFGSDGVITNKYTYAGGEIATINFYKEVDGVLYFLISTGGGDKVPYKIVKISGSKLVSTGVSFHVIAPDNDYSEGNDSYYDLATKQLYVTKFKRIDDTIVKNNRIYQYDLDRTLSGSSLSFNAKRVLQIDSNDDETKFEIEGLAIYDNKKYVCANVVIGNATDGSDGIFKLYV
jgi:hypothetical protein